MSKKINVSDFRNETQEFATKRSEDAITKAIEHGRQTFASGSPKLVGDALNLYTNPIKSWFTTISAEVNSKINSAEHMMVGSYNKGAYEDQEATFQENMRKSTEKINNLDRDHKQVSNPNSWKANAYLVVGFSIAFTEAIYSTSAIEGATTSMITKIMMFCGLFAAYVIISKSIPWWIGYLAQFSKLKRRLAYTGTVALLCSGFWFLGSWRISSLAATAIGSEEVVTSPLKFMVVNILLLLSSVACHFFRSFYTTPGEDKKKAREYSKEKKNLQKQLKTEEAEFKTFQKEYPEDQAARVQLLSSINPIHDLIEAKYLEAVEAFKSEIISRSQGSVPDCLNQKTEPLEIADHFSQEQFNNQNS